MLKHLIATGFALALTQQASALDTSRFFGGNLGSHHWEVIESDTGLQFAVDMSALRHIGVAVIAPVCGVADSDCRMLDFDCSGHVMDITESNRTGWQTVGPRSVLGAIESLACGGGNTTAQAQLPDNNWRKIETPKGLIVAIDVITIRRIQLPSGVAKSARLCIVDPTNGNCVQPIFQIAFDCHAHSSMVLDPPPVPPTHSGFEPDIPDGPLDVASRIVCGGQR